MKRLALLFLMSLVSASAEAAVYDTSALGELIGSRAVSNAPPPIGLTTAEPDWQDVEISWSILFDPGDPGPGDDTYTYTYTITGMNSPAISHFTLDISNNALTDPNAITGAKLDGNLIAGSRIEKGNKNGITGAVKFDVGSESPTSVYSFTSNRSPVYGDLFIKGGSTSLTNTGFTNHASSNINDFIARPNGVITIIPEPLGAGLLATGAALMLYRRR